MPHSNHSRGLPPHGIDQESRSTGQARDPTDPIGTLTLTWTSVVLNPPEAADLTDDERKLHDQLIAKSNYMLVFAADDLDKTYEQIRAAGAEVVQELEDHPYGVRDCAFRDPAGNIVRIQQAD